jgi:glycosidase
MQRKPLFIALLALCGLLFFLAISRPAPNLTQASSAASGDVNCDGATDAADALFILQYAAGMRTGGDCPLAANQLDLAQCDVDGSGGCDTADAAIIMQCDVGLNNPLCPAGGTATPSPSPTATTPPPTATPVPGEGIIINYKGWSDPNIYAWIVDNGTTVELRGGWPGTPMTAVANGWYRDEFLDQNGINLIFNSGGQQTADLSRTTGEWWYFNGQWTDYDPEDSEPPTISIISPTGGSPTGVVPIVVAAADNVGIDRVEYFFGPRWIGTAVADPWGYDWDTDFACSGTGDLTAVAYDLAGNSAVSNAVPLTITSPNLPPVANAGNDFRGVTNASVRFDGSGSYDPDCGIVSWEWSNGMSGERPLYFYDTPGVYTVTLTVADADGAVASDDVVVTINEQRERTDAREETIYFLITTRFYDGDPDNNVYSWDDFAAGNVANNDPAWRGDFKGLVEKLDYIKALGFSAIWITPILENMSGYDYHGYHTVNFERVDPRYESPGYDFQRVIDEVHARDMKIYLDVVFNHSSNFGEQNIYPMFAKDYSLPDTFANLVNIAPPGRLPENYDSLTPQQQYAARINAMKNDEIDILHIYHHEHSLDWEGYTVQTGQIAGDCVDLNTENPLTYNYLVNAFYPFIDMGVDGFRVDTVKHISRLTFNMVFNPAFKARGGENFFMFGEVASRYRQVWNSNIPAISVPFYSWAESQHYPWSDTDRLVNEALTFQHWNDNQNVAAQPSSDNHLLINNVYRQPDRSMSSGMDMIDFPMHWNFANARDSFNLAVGTDYTYNDATWNVVYVDSHDYAPDTAPENQRFALGQDVWAENLSLMFTFRGIPTIYYGSEIEFKKGHVIDVGPNMPLEETGRAYFGDHITGSVDVLDFGVYANATGNMADSLNHPLAQHIRRLNLIRREIPALQKGQYSVENVSGSGYGLQTAVHRRQCGQLCPGRHFRQRHLHEFARRNLPGRNHGTYRHH